MGNFVRYSRTGTIFIFFSPPTKCLVGKRNYCDIGIKEDYSLSKYLPSAWVSTEDTGKNEKDKFPTLKKKKIRKSKGVS